MIHDRKKKKQLRELLGLNQPDCKFLPERDYVTFESLLSQFRLSSVVVLSVVPTQGVEAVGNISSAVPEIFQGV